MTADVTHALVDGIDRDSNNPRMWTVAQLARASQMSEWSIRRAIALGQLVAVRRGRLLRVGDVEARRWLGL